MSIVKEKNETLAAIYPHFACRAAFRKKKKNSKPANKKSYC